MQWFMQNWIGVVVALLAIDRAVERLFPNAKLLKQIDDTLSKFVPPSA